MSFQAAKSKVEHLHLMHGETEQYRSMTAFKFN